MSLYINIGYNVHDKSLRYDSMRFILYDKQNIMSLKIIYKYNMKSDR